MLLVLQSGCHSWWSSNLSLRRFITKSDTGALASVSTKSQSFIHSGTRRSNPTRTYRNLSEPIVPACITTPTASSNNVLRYQLASEIPNRDALSLECEEELVFIQEDEGGGSHEGRLAHLRHAGVSDLHEKKRKKTSMCTMAAGGGVV